MLSTLKIDETINKLYSQNLQILNRSQLIGKVQTHSTFADNDDFDLPLQISGRLITSGVYDDNTFGKIEIPKEELRKAAPKWEGLEIYKHHGVFRAIHQNQDVSVGEVVGKIVKTEFNEEQGAINFIGEIVDEDIARKIFHGLIKFVSVGFGRDPDKKDDRAILRNIEPKETSLVFKPRDRNARIRVHG